MLKFAVLGFLNYGEMSGYDIKTQMATSTGYFWHANISQIYATLKKLEADLLVTSEMVEQDTRPDRRVYRITEAGRDELIGWLNTPHQGLDPRKEALLLRVFFSAQADKGQLLTQLRVQHQLHEKQAEHYAAIGNDICATRELHPALARDAVLWEATRRFGERIERMYTDWIAEVIVTIEDEL